MMVDLLNFLRGSVGPDGVSGKPVGVRHKDGNRTFDGIFQVQRDGQTRRWFQVKGAWDNPPPESDWQEHWYDDAAIYMAIDTSRPSRDGGPYTLLDAGAVRGSKWAARRMAVNDVFARNPYVVAFDLKTGARLKQDGPVRTWLKLAARHDTWRGIADVIELWWLTSSPTQATPAERYYYARGLGLVGFEGPDQRTYPNGVFPDFPPAVGVPVLKRKPAPWLPAMPAETPAPKPPPKPGDFYLLNPAHSFPHVIWSGYGERETPETTDPPGTMEDHFALDVVPAGGAVAPFPVVAAHAGTVVLAGWNDQGYGYLVKLDDGAGNVTLYAHLEAGSIAVQVGHTVTRGQFLGRLGATGRVTGPHLHFEYRRDGVLTNPTPLLYDTIQPEEPPVVTPDPQPEPTPEPEPPDGLPSPWLTSDELRQLIAATTRQRDALNEQIAIYQRALLRASA
jgi:murein DD-endopeptidase MepM/ murein hydrolase activator NlpD